MKSRSNASQKDQNLINFTHPIVFSPSKSHFSVFTSSIFSSFFLDSFTALVWSSPRTGKDRFFVLWKMNLVFLRVKTVSFVVVVINNNNWENAKSTCLFFEISVIYRQCLVGKFTELTFRCSKMFQFAESIF